jgi:hypothetical protein
LVAAVQRHCHTLPTWTWTYKLWRTHDNFYVDELW